MKIKILGGHGGLARGFSTTSFLIDDELLIDAGSVASTLSVEEQSKINHILISHSHLDHIKDLAFICDNCFGAIGARLSSVLLSLRIPIEFIPSLIYYFL